MKNWLEQYKGTIGFSKEQLSPQLVNLFEQDKKNINVIVYCGYEGLEELVFASTNDEETKIKMNELKADAIKRNEEAEKFSYDERNELLESEKDEDQELYSKLFFDLKDADRYCVMTYDGTKFKCTCNELGVAPSKQWLY